MFQCQNIFPRVDMNGDYVYTISDLWLQIKTVFFIPARLLVEVLASFPGVARFLELNCWSGESVMGGAVSMLAWFFAIGIVGSVLMAGGNSPRK